MKSEKLTTLGQIAAGGWAFVSHDKKPTFGGAVIGVVWPAVLLIVAASWVVYGIYYGAYYVYYSAYYVIYYAGWFIFGGGGAKLLGLV